MEDGGDLGLKGEFGGEENPQEGGVFWVRAPGIEGPQEGPGA